MQSKEERQGGPTQRERELKEAKMDAMLDREERRQAKDGIRVEKKLGRHRRGKIKRQRLRQKH